jgi:hypothetical protein
MRLPRSYQVTAIMIGLVMMKTPAFPRLTDHGVRISKYQASGRPRYVQAAEIFQRALTWGRISARTLKPPERFGKSRTTTLPPVTRPARMVPYVGLLKPTTRAAAAAICCPSALV